MKYLTLLPILAVAILAGYALYVHFHPVEQPKIEVVVPEIRTPQKTEVKPLYVDPKYECKGVCK